MATLLYRLGQFSAKRAWLVIATWVVILAATATTAITAGGVLSSSISIEGVKSQQVIEELRKTFPEASRGSGQVVFHKSDGTTFTEADKAAIATALEEVKAQAGVAEVLNPFTISAEIADKRKAVKDGWAQYESGISQIESGQKQIDEGRAKLAAAKADLEAKSAQLEAGIAQLEANNAPAQMLAPYLENRAKLAAGLTQIKAQAKALDDGQKKLTANSEKLASAKADLTLADTLLVASAEFTTVSKDDQTALATIQFKVPTNELEEPTKTAAVDALKNADLNGVQVEFSQELTRSLSDILGVGELVGLGIAALVLFIMLGTLIGAGLPVISAVVGVGISATITLALASVIEMTSTTPVLGVMLGLAVGIDYSLFILNRHRAQLKGGLGMLDSISLANGTSGNAVLFAGITVIIALAALNLTGIGFIGLMGSMGAISIAVAVLIALTATPALLSLIGFKILSKKERAELASGEHLAENKEPKNVNKKVWVNQHPWLTLISSTAVLVILALPFSSLRLGLPDGSSEPENSTPYRAYMLTSEAFGPGFNGQIATVVTLPKPATDDEILKDQAAIATDLFDLDNVVAVVPAMVSDDKTTMLFQVVPSGEPLSIETQNLVHDIRALEGKISDDFGARIGVTGLTASNIDISQKIADVLPLYLGTVLALSLLLLILVFRSILVPLLAAAGFLLTVFATLGTVVAVYQWGWLAEVFGVINAGPILSFLPIFLIGILFGLAMDYQLFLVSGMREAYTHGKSARDSITYGIHLSRSVVVAAALIMVTVFGGFAFSHLSMIRPVGFGLAIGVLLDAFIVRLLLVPAAMSILGKAVWWMPKWLDRLLPDVDVEGARLDAAKLH